MSTLSFIIIWNQTCVFRQRLDHRAPLHQSRLAYNCTMDIPAMLILYHGGSAGGEVDGYDACLTAANGVLV